MSGLRYAYITNGMADHRLDDALKMLSDFGYSGVGLTLDHQHLDPFAPDLAKRVTHIAEVLRDLKLAVVIETGGRFVLDPYRKQEPTMLSDEGREHRIGLLQLAVSIGADLGAEAVSFWSGRARGGLSHDVAWQRLVDGCALVLDAADARGMRLAFEPEPGMFIEYVSQWEALAGEFSNPAFGVTLDLGHCFCIEDASVADCIRRVGDRLYQVHIEDMNRGVHKHLDFGTGSMDFPPALGALHEVGYTGLVSVELSRHSHSAASVVPHAIEFLKNAEPAR